MSARARRRRGRATRRCPSRVHAIVLVSKLHKPTLRALAYARATRPVVLEAVTVDVDPEETARAARRSGTRRGIPVPLQGARLAVPRDHPADHRLRAARSGGTARATWSSVYIPEYVVGHWWEQLLHNQSALRLKGRLLFTPGRDGDQRARGSWPRPRALERPGRSPSATGRPRRGAPGCQPTPGREPPHDAPRPGRATCRRRREPTGPVTARPDAVEVGAESSSSRSARSPTAATAWPGTRAGSSSSGTRCPASGCGVRVTDGGDGDRFWRADAVEVLEASPDRVDAAVPGRRPGRLRRLRLAARRRRGAAPAEGRRRRASSCAGSAGLDVATSTVEAVPGDADGLGWRTRVRFAVDAAGPAGLRRHRSHDVVAVDALPDRHPELTPSASRARWAGRRRRRGGGTPGRPASGSSSSRRRPARRRCRGSRRAASVRRRPQGAQRVRGRGWVQRAVRVDGAARDFRVTGAGFWQVHPGAAQTPASTPSLGRARAAAGGARARPVLRRRPVRRGASPPRSGRTGAVARRRGRRRARSRDARRNLHDLPQVRLHAGRVDDALAGCRARAGARERRGPRRPRPAAQPAPGAVVVERLARAAPRGSIAYVACDPAALARDVATFGAARLPAGRRCGPSTCSR